MGRGFDSRHLHHIGTCTLLTWRCAEENTGLSAKQETAARARPAPPKHGDCRLTVGLEVVDL